MALLGTDYQSAYMGDELNQMNIPMNNHPPVIPTQKEREFDYNNNENINTEKMQQNNMSNEPQKNIVYDQNMFLNDMQQDSTIDQISILKKELQKQKDLQMKMNYENESTIDRYLSKKKDVFKLLNLSLTILLGISLHFVVTDYIRDYIKNTDLSDNKELLIKIAYPLTIFFILWTLKVFNK